MAGVQLRFKWYVLYIFTAINLFVYPYIQTLHNPPELACQEIQSLKNVPDTKHMWRFMKYLSWILKTERNLSSLQCYDLVIAAPIVKTLFFIRIN